MEAVTVTVTVELPPDVAAFILDFCAQQKTGQVVLHVKSGDILQMEANAIQKRKPTSLNA